MGRLRPIGWLCLLCLLAFGACGATGRVVPEVQDGRGPGPVPPRYEGSLRALSAALADGLDDSARNMIQRLRARLVRDEFTGLLDLEGARAFVEGCARVIEGRSRVRACSFSLEFRRIEGERELSLFLVIESQWPAELTFMPGVAQVTVDRAFMEPSGELVQITRRVGLDNQESWVVPAESTVEYHLGDWPTGMARGSLAGRIRVDLKALAPQVKEAAAFYSAGGLRVAQAVHVELAGFLPTQAVSPGDLLPAVLDPTVGIHGLVERIVRLKPSLYREAEGELVGLIGRATDLEISARIAPALRWVTGGACPGSDPREWRLWAVQGFEEKSTRKIPSMLDLPCR